MYDSDHESEPNALGRHCEETIAALLIERDALLRSERKEVNQKLQTARYLLRWCKTRAGYVAE